eukprot:314830-Pyramimonas_sp.AAC.1
MVEAASRFHEQVPEHASAIDFFSLCAHPNIICSIALWVGAPDPCAVIPLCGPLNIDPLCRPCVHVDKTARKLNIPACPPLAGGAWAVRNSSCRKRLRKG